MVLSEEQRQDLADSVTEIEHLEDQRSELARGTKEILERLKKSMGLEASHVRIVLRRRKQKDHDVDELDMMVKIIEEALTGQG